MEHLIKAGTVMSCDGSRDEEYRYYVDGFENPLIGDIPIVFYKTVLENDKGFGVDDYFEEGCPTLETWAESLAWKGACPCNSASSAFDEGYGPRFLLPFDAYLYSGE